MMTLTTVELTAYLVAAFVYGHFSSTPNKKLFYFAYTIAIFGASIIIINNYRILWLDMIGEFITKFGIASAFQGVYLNTNLFPIAYSSSTF